MGACVCVCTLMYVCVCTCMRLCVHACACVCTCVPMCACVCMPLCTCVCVCVCVCVRVCVRFMCPPEGAQVVISFVPKALSMLTGPRPPPLWPETRRKRAVCGWCSLLTPRARNTPDTWEPRDLCANPHVFALLCGPACSGLRGQAFQSVL